VRKKAGESRSGFAVCFGERGTPYAVGDGKCAEAIEGIVVAGEVKVAKGAECLLGVEKRGRNWVLTAVGVKSREEVGVWGAAGALSLGGNAASVRARGLGGVNTRNGSKSQRYCQVSNNTVR